jgi:ATP-dependent protease HslVU (ClpYQ) ATPase subunit
VVERREKESSFKAKDYNSKTIEIDTTYIKGRRVDLVKKTDLPNFI